MAAPTEGEEKKEESHTEAAPKKGKKKLLLILIPVVLLLVGGGAAFVLLGSGGDEHGEEEEVEAPRHYATHKLDPFIVNLADSAAYVKVTMVVEYDVEILAAAAEGGAAGGGGHGGGGAGGGDAGPTAPPLFSAREPMLRDSVIRILSQKKQADVLSMQGKEILKEELLDALNEASGLEEAPFISIYFLEFIVQ